MALIQKWRITSVGKDVRMYSDAAALETSLAAYLFPIATVKNYQKFIGLKQSYSLWF